MLDKNNRTPERRAMSVLRDGHTQSEFETSSVENTREIMSEDPHINHVPIMPGGAGRGEVARFYSEWFITKRALEADLTFVSRTVGGERLVDGLISDFTHTVAMDSMLPGVPPTGNRVEAPLMGVGFQDRKMISEHIYRDQVSVLVRDGLLGGSR